jgi:predicted peroxiredoxin
MTRLTALIIASLFMSDFMGASGALTESDQQADAIPAEDYALYDQVVTSKVFTSATQLVVSERMARLRLSPAQEGQTTIEEFQEQGISMASCRRT